MLAIPIRMLSGFAAVLGFENQNLIIAQEKRVTSMYRKSTEAHMPC